MPGSLVLAQQETQSRTIRDVELLVRAAQQELTRQDALRRFPIARFRLGQGPASALFLEARGWGFGVSVALSPDDDWSRAGRYGWDGGLGTSWLNDPEAGVAAILVTQRFPPPFELFTDFWTGVTATWCA